IECRREDARIEGLISTLRDADAQDALAAERALNARLQGGCQVPIAGHATIVGETLAIEGLVASLDGRQVIRASRLGRREDAAALGVAVGDALLADGAAALLAAIGAH
ncbi:MAG: hydroxymethylbilane synthase, partial [Chloroflexi bacterium]|nr:hydroxymethylbilane synthase [Chloroflexota bacterium]